MRLVVVPFVQLRVSLLYCLSHSWSLRYSTLLVSLVFQRISLHIQITGLSL